MEPANRAPRRDPPRETASGLPRSPRSSAFFPTSAREIPFFPLQPGRRSVPPFLPSFTPATAPISRSDVDFRESNDPFSKDPILSRLSGTREPGLSRPLPLRPSSLPSPHFRYSFIYSLAAANNGSRFLPRMESIVLLGSAAYYDCMDGRSYESVRARSGLLGDLQNVYIYRAARAMILAKVLVRLSFHLFFLPSIRCLRRLNVSLV